MLPRSKRLPKEEFSHLRRVKVLLSTRKSEHAPYFLIKYKTNGRIYNRFAVIVGTNVDKRSTRRHLWKRRFLARLRMWPDNGKDFLIVTHPAITTLGAADLAQMLSSLGKELFSK